MSDTFPRVGSALIVRDEANRILLGKRNKDPQRGSWILPGGKIQAFESIAQAAARELEEETGLEVEVQNEFRVYEIINPPNEHRIVIYSWARVRGGCLAPADDVSEVKFVSLDELGELPLTPLVRQVLHDAGYLGANPRSEHEGLLPSTPSLFPIPIAGAVTRRPLRTRRKASSHGIHRRRPPLPLISLQASLSFEGSIAD